jgi:hypothetical protein
VAKLANERVEDARKITRGLRFALSLLAEPDRAQSERMKPQTEKSTAFGPPAFASSLRESLRNILKRTRL